VGVPVVVVGNLVVGGAGKTPTVIALVRALRARGRRPGVVSRGYARSSQTVRLVTMASTPDEVGDEPLLIHRRTQAPMAVHRDRVAAACALLERHRDEIDIVIADDGLQHHRLARDAQVIVVDERGFGNGYLLPAGPLREAPGLQPPPRSLVLYNATSASTPWPGWVAQRRLEGAVALADWWRGQAADASTLNALSRHALIAAAGIAVPDRFFGMLRDCGLSFSARTLPDHHDWRGPFELPDGCMLIVTEKDAVKLPADHALAHRTWVAPLDFCLPDDFVDALLTLIDDGPHR
jgi:tetraacyldisaccharide 4'-kinase